MSQQSITSWIRHPASIILTIVLIVMFVMLADQSQRRAVPSPASGMTPTAPSVADMPVAPPGQSSLPMGGDVPRIVQRIGAPPPIASMPGKTAPGPLAAPDLGSLLGRLEDKVKAEPDKIGNRMLLAQTYSELGLSDKALDEARETSKRFPENARAKLVLAAILSKRQDEKDLKEAVGILKELRSGSEVKLYLVEMYIGDTMNQLGDHQSALASWKLALKDMPLSDNRRKKIEKNIADLSAAKSGS